MANERDSAELDETLKPIPEDDFPGLVRSRIQEWESHSTEWLEEARTNFEQVAGRQWKDEDKKRMEELGRPMVTLNSLAAMVRSICGLEINSRQAVTYFGRFPQVSGKAEMLTQAAKYVRDESNAEDEESAAFRDMVICGMGFTETRWSLDDNPQGEVWIERLDPLQCAWDSASRRRGLQDARWLALWRDIPRGEIERLWPDKADDVAMAYWPPDSAGTTQPHDASSAPWYPSTAVGMRPKNTARVVQYQYWRDEQWVKVTGPQGQIELPAKKYLEVASQAKASGLMVEKLKPRRGFRQAIVSADILLEDKPLPVSNFTIKAMTGITDRNEGMWYGFVRDLVDPQKFINKFVSLAIDILAANAKGGLIAEQDAFVSVKKAEQDWSNPNKIVWVKPGGIAKVQERAPVRFPEALSQLMTFAIEGMPRISGVNLEFLGAQTNNQAGVLEYQRKQAVVSGLAEFFGALRLYRKLHGKILAQFIAKYMGDGRLVRVIGPVGAQYMPLILDPNSTEYDLVVDEAPSAPDTKARTWAALSEILPAAMKMGIPIPPEILDYSPLPTSLAEKWKESIEKAKAGPQALPPEVQDGIQKMGEELQKLQQENQQLKLNTQAKIMQIQAEREQKAEELNLEGQSKMAEIKLKGEIAVLEADLAREKMLLELAIEREKVLAEIELKRQASEADIGIAAAEAHGKMTLAKDEAQGKMALAHEAAGADRKVKETEHDIKSSTATMMTKAIEALSAPKTRQISLKHAGGKLVGADISESAAKKPAKGKSDG